MMLNRKNMGMNVGETGKDCTSNLFQKSSSPRISGCLRLLGLTTRQSQYTNHPSRLETLINTHATAGQLIAVNYLS